MAVAEIVTILTDLIDPPPLLLIGVSSRVEDNPVAGLEWAQCVKGHEIRAKGGNRPKKGAPLLAIACVNQFLVVHPVHPTGRQPPRESHLKLIAILDISFGRTAGKGCIDRLSVDLTDSRDILRRLQPSLDLEALHSCLDQGGDIIYRSKILRREKVAFVSKVPEHAVDHELIGHPAGLRTFAPIGTPLSQGLTREALTGVGDTERPVNKNLQGHPFRVKTLKFAEGEFTGKDRAGNPEPPGHLDTLR